MVTVGLGTLVLMKHWLYPPLVPVFCHPWHMALDCPYSCSSCLPATLQPYLQDDHNSIMQEVLQDYVTKAEAFRADLNDKRLTVEHMVLAMAEVTLMLQQHTLVQNHTQTSPQDSMIWALAAGA